MSNILFGDTETTGLPIWKIPSDDESQPHIVQLAAVLCNEDREITQSMDVIVKPNCWDISKEVSDIHGITHEMAMDIGVPEKLALEMYMALWDACDLRVFHNTVFDNRMLRIALKRYLPDLVSDETWKNKEFYYCTLMASRKIMGGKSGHTLSESYLHFTVKEMGNAHSAMPDALACKDIYYAIQDLP